MDDLVDDCVQAILGWLPLSERLRLEKVCRRWRQLMPYADIACFTLDHLDWHRRQRHVHEITYERGGLTHTHQVFHPKWFKHYLAPLLTRFGPFLRDLTLSGRQDFRVVVTRDLLRLVVAGAPALEFLNLNTSLLESDVIAVFNECAALRYVNLAGCVFMQPGVALGDACNSALKQHDSVKAEFDRFVATHPSLRLLNLAQLPFVPELNNGSLRKLHLQSVSLGDDDLERICSLCPQLESLGLNSCRRVSNFAPVSRLDRLRGLWANNTRLNDADLAAICRALPQLQRLRIDGCSRIGDFGPLKAMRVLRQLWVGPSQHFTDVTLARVARFGTLENVVFSNCQLSDQAFKYLATHCPNLAEISAVHTRLTDDGACALFAACTRLTLVNVQFTSVSNELLRVAGERGGALQYLYVQSCRDVDETGFDALAHVRARRRDVDGQPLVPLTVMAGGQRGMTVPRALCDRLALVQVNVINQKPTLAIASA